MPSSLMMFFILPFTYRKPSSDGNSLSWLFNLISFVPFRELLSSNMHADSEGVINVMGNFPGGAGYNTGLGAVRPGFQGQTCSSCLDHPESIIRYLWPSSVRWENSHSATFLGILWGLNERSVTACYRVENTKGHGGGKEAGLPSEVEVILDWMFVAWDILVSLTFLPAAFWGL